MHNAARTWRTLAIASILTVCTATAAFAQATVATDRADYAPGDTVLVTGTGWSPGEIVTLTFTRDPAGPAPAVYTVTADPSGNILHHELAILPEDGGVAFTLVATGQTSGAGAQTTFRDATLTSVTVGPQSPSPVTAGSTASYTVTVARTSGWCFWGSVTANLSLSSAPPGTSYSFSPPTLTFNGCATLTSTLNIYTHQCTSQSGSFEVVAALSGNPNDYVYTFGYLSVTGVDTEAPVPNVTNLPTISDSCRVCMGSTSPTAWDHCDGTIYGVPSSYGRCLYDPGSFTIRWTYTDRSGNSSYQDQRFVVTGSPYRTDVPGVLTYQTGPSATTCSVAVPASDYTRFHAWNACESVNLSYASGVPSGGRFPVGSTTLQVYGYGRSLLYFPLTIVVQDNTPPALVPPADITVPTDPGQWTAMVDFQVQATDNCPGVTWQATPPSGSAFPIGTTTVTCTATDAAGNQVTDSFDVTVVNPAPVASITGPPSGTICAVGVPQTFTGAFTDNPGDVHTAQWTVDGATVPGVVDEATGAVTLSRSFAAAGVYLVSLTVTDQCGGASTATTVGGLDAMIVVYDPAAGFVTGGGWIQSPPGAWTADPTLAGKANFGFVSRYKRGAVAPSGETEFQFKVADLNFHSGSYEWLVIAGARAQFKGTGTINGAGSYGFLLTALDGGLLGGIADRFRIKITDKATGLLVYDNQLEAPDGADPTAALGGGSIVIQTDGARRAVLAPDATPDAAPSAGSGLPERFVLEPSRPNPFRGSTVMRFGLPVPCRVMLAVLDLAGREVASLVAGERGAGWHAVEWTGAGRDGALARAGVYFYRLTAAPLGGGAAYRTTGKVIRLD